MAVVIEFDGPVAARFAADKTPSLLLEGAVRDEAGVRALVSFVTAADPRLPSELQAATLLVDGDRLEDYRIRTTAHEYRIEARQMFVHRDLRVPMRAIVPPQPVSFGYRLRWRLAVWLARLPFIRS